MAVPNVCAGAIVSVTASCFRTHNKACFHSRVPSKLSTGQMRSTTRSTRTRFVSCLCPPPPHWRKWIGYHLWSLQRISESSPITFREPDLPGWALTCWWSPMRMRCWHPWLSVVMVWASRTCAASSTITRRAPTSCRTERYLAAPVVVMPITCRTRHCICLFTHNTSSSLLITVWLMLLPQPVCNGHEYNQCSLLSTMTHQGENWVFKQIPLLATGEELITSFRGFTRFLKYPRFPANVSVK